MVIRGYWCTKGYFLFEKHGSKGLLKVIRIYIFLWDYLYYLNKRGSNIKYSWKSLSLSFSKFLKGIAKSVEYLSLSFLSVSFSLSLSLSLSLSVGVSVYPFSLSLSIKLHQVLNFLQSFLSKCKVILYLSIFQQAI